MLTAKQEKYVLGIVEGLTQREAYKRAYPNTKMKDKTIDENASRLYKDSKIQARYRELMDEFKKNAIWTRQDAVNELIWLKDKAKADINESGVRQANSNAFTNAIKELNSIEGLYIVKANEDKESKIANSLQGLLESFKGEGEC